MCPSVFPVEGSRVLTTTGEVHRWMLYCGNNAAGDAGTDATINTYGLYKFCITTGVLFSH